MRTPFVEFACRAAERDPRLVLLTGDLGFMVLEPFRDRFPDRFFNVGVAEQNMIGVATGLAEAGFLPFAYSIAPFASLRPLEFIRNGPVLHGLPVRIVGMGMGFDYGHAGPSHYGTEDVAVLRSFAGLRIVIPADAKQATTALEATWDLPGPTYYSLSKDDRLVVPGLDGRYEPGRLQVVRRGQDVALIAMGSLAGEAVHAAEELAALGIQATVAVVSGFHPDPVDDVLDLLGEFDHAVSVEAQAVSGGLASFLGLTLAEHGLRCRLWPLSVRVRHDGTSGGIAERWARHGLDRANIVRSARAALGASAR